MHISSLCIGKVLGNCTALRAQRLATVLHPCAVHSAVGTPYVIAICTMAFTGWHFTVRNAILVQLPLLLRSSM
jgi:hypothetical protein